VASNVTGNSAPELQKARTRIVRRAAGRELGAVDEGKRLLRRPVVDDVHDIEHHDAGEDDAPPGHFR
jgi:hypothetical protein